MKKTLKKLIAAACAVTMLGCSAGALAACGGGKGGEVAPDYGKGGSATYNTYVEYMPTNWNELNYQNNSDTAILDYIVSPMFEYDYVFDEAKGGRFTADGKVNAAAIKGDGAFVTSYAAATALEDVTSSVDAKYGYTAEQKAAGGYAWKITLRQDLKWDDGTDIKAEDFVYSMKEQLDPEFLNYRANTWYQQIPVINAKNYYNKLQTETYDEVYDHGYETIQAALDADEDVYWQSGLYGATGAVKLTSFNASATTYADAFTIDTSAPALGIWASAQDDETLYLDPMVEDYLIDGEFDPDAYGEGDEYEFESLEELISAMVFTPKAAFADLYAYYGDETFKENPGYVAIKVVNTHTDTEWTDVGFYKDGEYSFVVCLEKPFEFLNDEGGLSFWAAYYMSSFPLVKHDLYESCKQPAVSGSTLKTSTYNTTLATTASWGPYKLTGYQTGKSFTLEKNPYWFGYNLEEYQDQYLIEKIETELLSDPNTQWMKFLNGTIDDAGLDADHLDDYKNSKYTIWATGTGSTNVLLYPDLNKLKTSTYGSAETPCNAGILAIKDFREAVSLSIDRALLVDTIWPGTQVVSYGYLNDMYYVDVEAGLTYRSTPQAKEALLRGYGWTKAANGTWSDGANLTGLTADEALSSLAGGKNLAVAKEKLASAIEELTANAEKYGYDSSKDIVLIYGYQQAAGSATVGKRKTFLQNAIDELTAGTALAGKIKIYDQYTQDQATDFKNGACHILVGAGFTGNALNPFNMIGCYANSKDSLNYFTNSWDTNAVNVTITLPAAQTGESFDQAGQTVTMSLQNWFYCLNGLAETENATYKYNWENAPTDVRLTILAAIEETVLTNYISISCGADYQGALLGKQFSYISYDYSLFMGYGGMRYMRVDYSDKAWENYVKSKSNNLESEYKKAA